MEAHKWGPQAYSVRLFAWALRRFEIDGGGFSTGDGKFNTRSHFQRTARSRRVLMSAPSGLQATTTVQNMRYIECEKVRII